MVSVDVATIAVNARPALLRHAVRLTGDEAAAEDLVQDAYLRFVERPPRSRKAAKVKGWLMIVMRNLWADRFPRIESLRDANRATYRRAALHGGVGREELLSAAAASSLDELN